MAGYKFGNKANFGENSTLSGSFQYVFGSGNSNSADYTMVGGINNTVVATGEESLVWGSGNLISGANNLVFGADHVLSNAADFNIVGGTTCSGTSGGVDYNILVGYSCKSTNRGNVTYGRNNINDTDFLGMGYHMVGGSGNTVSGSYFGITVGEDNIAPEQFESGLQIGESGSSPNIKKGAISTAAGKFAAVGDSQLTTHLVYRGTTTNDTATAIYNAGSSSFKWTLAANDSVIVKATVIGRKTGDAGQSASYEVIAAFKRQGATSTIGTTGVTKRVLNEDTGTTDYDATLAVNDTDDTFELKVTGDTGHTVNWMAHVEVLHLNVA
jgi:hypothetical protein